MTSCLIGNFFIGHLRQRKSTFALKRYIGGIEDQFKTLCSRSVIKTNLLWSTSRFSKNFVVNKVVEKKEFCAEAPLSNPYFTPCHKTYDFLCFDIIVKLKVQEHISTIAHKHC